MKKIRVGVIGANVGRGWATRAHLPALLALDEYELAAVCTTRQQSADEAAQKFGAHRAYDDFNKLVADKDIDLVVVCVRVDRHFGPVMAALNAGKHVFCEWPLGHSTAEAETMTELARTKRVVNQVGLQTRLSPVMRHVAALIEQGFIGSLRSVTAHSATTQWGARSTQEFLYGADIKVGVNVVNIHAAHLIDALCHTLEPFSRLSAIMTNVRKQTQVVETGEIVPFTSPDQLAVSGQFESGAVASLHFQSGVANISGVRIEIRGTDADLVITSDGHIPTATLRLFAGKIGEKDLSEIKIPESYTSADLRSLPQVTASIAEAYRGMARAINGATSASPSFEDALALHRLMDGIKRTSETGSQFVRKK